VNIKSFIWLSDVIDKIESKHGVTGEEVEEIFRPGAVYRRGPRGKKRKGEDVYKAVWSGRGRPLSICRLHLQTRSSRLDSECAGYG